MDSICYICLEPKQDLSSFMPKNIQSSFPVCQDCLEETIPKWTLEQWKARPDQYIKRKNQSTLQNTQEQAKSKPSVEQEKEVSRNMYIFLEQNVLKYSMKERTWEGIQLTLDLDSTLISPEDELSFSLLSTSSGCVSIQGQDWVDIVITGGLLYPLFSFFGNLNKEGNAVNLTSGPKLLEARHQHAMAASEEQITQKVFSAGGLKAHDDSKKEASLKIEELSLKKQSAWSEMGKLKEPRISAAALVIKEVLFIFGGFNLTKTKQDHFLQTLDLKSKDQRVLSVNLAQEMAYPLAGFRIARESPVSEKVLIFGGTQENYAFNCIYSLNTQNQMLEFVMYTYNCRADFAIGYVNQENVVLVGGAQSGGNSEVIDLTNKTSTPLFQYQNCLETIPSSQGVEWPDLRWCCYFFK